MRRCVPAAAPVQQDPQSDWSCVVRNGITFFPPLRLYLVPERVGHLLSCDFSFLRATLIIFVP